MRRSLLVLVSLLVVVAIASAGFLLGRRSVDGAVPRDAAYREGQRAGEAIGLAEGRALQVGTDAGASAADAFRSGYTTGADDVFAGYDGGWDLGVPYVVTLAQGAGGTTYRIDSRAVVEPATTYRACGDSLCPVP